MCSHEETKDKCPSSVSVKSIFFPEGLFPYILVERTINFNFMNPSCYSPITKNKESTILCHFKPIGLNGKVWVVCKKWQMNFTPIVSSRFGPGIMLLYSKTAPSTVWVI